MSEKYALRSTMDTYSSNKVAQILKVLAIANFVIVLFLDYSMSFNLYTAAGTLSFFALALLGFMSSALIWGIGEIVQLLHNIYYRQAAGYQIVKELKE